MAVAMAARQTVGITGNLLAVAEVLFSVVFIALVVQEHPLVGTTAFWMTRPMPAASAARIQGDSSGCGRRCGPRHRRSGADDRVRRAGRADRHGRRAKRAVLGVVALRHHVARRAHPQPGEARAASLAAALSPIVVLIVTTVAILLDRMSDEPPLSGGGDAYNPTSDVARTVMVIAAAIVLLAVQYRTRARARAVAIGVAGVVIAWIAGSAWPWPCGF